MKRISIVVILMLVLAACSSSSGVDPSGPSSSSPSPSSPSPNSSPSSSSSPSRGAYSTVSGRIVRLDTGKPYPNAYVRFGWLVDANHEMEIHTVTDGNGPVPGDGGRRLRPQRWVRHRREGSGRRNDLHTWDQRGGLRRVPDHPRGRSAGRVLVALDGRRKSVQTMAAPPAADHQRHLAHLPGRRRDPTPARGCA